MDLLKQVNKEYAFILQDGRRLNSIAELKASLADMDDNIFSHHVNDQKNDFSNWIKDIHNDDKLASMLEDAKNNLEAANAINSRIKELTTPKVKIKKARKKPLNELKEPLVIKLKDKNSKKNKEKIKFTIVKQKLNKPKLSKAEDIVKIKKNNKIIKEEKEPDNVEFATVQDKGLLAKTFMPFVKFRNKNKSIDYEKFRLDVDVKHIKNNSRSKSTASEKSKEPDISLETKSTSKIGKPIHKSNHHFMRCGVHEFFKGMILGLILGTIIASIVV